MVDSVEWLNKQGTRREAQGARPKALRLNAAEALKSATFHFFEIFNPC